MEIMRLVGFGVASTLLVLTLRAQRPELAMTLSLVAGLCIFALLADKLSGVVTVMRQLSDVAEIPAGSVRILLRVIGISYLAEFGAQMCRDAGEGGIASKVELGGRVLVLSMSTPIVAALVELVLRILP